MPEIAMQVYRKTTNGVFTVMEVHEKKQVDADVINDDSNGRTVIDELLKNYQEFIGRKYPNDSSSDAPRPLIYESLLLNSNEDSGISDELVAEYGDGLLVIVPNYKSMKAHDTVKLMWNGKEVASHKVRPGEENAFLTLQVDPSDVPLPGTGSLYYLVLRANSTFVESPAVKTLYRVGQPGVEGEQGIGEKLTAPRVVPRTIEPGSSHARVTIPAYLTMSAEDVIHLYVGHVLITRKVTEAECGQEVSIDVSEATFKLAGDGVAVPVSYYVVDEVGNESEGSHATLVAVKLQASELQAPLLRDKDRALIEGDASPEIFEGTHLTVHLPGPFRSGDSVVLSWEGCTEDGLEIPFTAGPKPVTDTATPPTFDIPNEALTPLGGGSARVTYRVVRAGQQIASPSTFISFKGMSVAHPPLLAEAEDDWIDSDLQAIHVVIPTDALLQAEDEIIVEWRGTAADGTVSLKTSKRYRVSAKQVGKQLTIKLAGKDYLMPFDGGFVDVFYQVNRNGRLGYSPRSTYQLGYLSESLPAPVTEPTLTDGILDPECSDYKYNMEIIIPSGAEQPAPCTIELYWSRSDGSFYEDEQVLEPGDEACPFQIPAEELELSDEKPVDVTVYYIVRWKGKPSRASQDFNFRIATAEMVKKSRYEVTVPAAKSGKLALGDLSDGYLSIEVQPYTNMTAGDKIIIKYAGLASDPHIVTGTGTQIIKLPLWKLLSVEGKTVLILAEITPQGATEPLHSKPLLLELIDAIQVETYESSNTGLSRHYNQNLSALRLQCSDQDFLVRFTHSPHRAGPRMISAGRAFENSPVKYSSTYRLTLFKPARKVFFGASGNGTIKALNGGKALTSINVSPINNHKTLSFSPTDKYYSLEAGPGEQITMLEVSSTPTTHVIWLALGALYIVY